MDRSSSWTNAGRTADYIPPSRVARMAIPSPRPPGSTAEAVATARRAEYGTGGSILPVLPTAPSASKRTSWTTPRSSSDSIDDDFYQSGNESFIPPPRRAEMASMAATRRAEPARPRSVSDDLYASSTEQAQLAYMEQMYGTINLLNAELENERRNRSALEAAATRPSTYPAMSDYSSLEEDVQTPVNEFDEPPMGFIVSQTPVGSTSSPRKLRTMPSPPSQPPQSQHRTARPPISPRAVVKDQDKELCATLGKNAELRIRSRGMERTVEKTELELELARKQIKMAERRAENREEKLRELLREKLNWQKEVKAIRAQVVEEKMRQVDLFREVEAAKRQFVAELEAVDQELLAAQEENTQLRTHAAELKTQMTFQARKMEEMARQAQDEKARFVAMIDDTRHRFREWKEGEAEALAAAHDQAMRNLKTEYELKMERHQDEKQKLRDKVNDLEVSMRLLQKDRTLSPLELSLRKTAILGSKNDSSTIEAEHIETQSRILELENLLAHSQAYQARQESIIKLSEATISRLMQAREVTALENLSLHPFDVESQRGEDLLYDTNYGTTPSSPARPMSPPKTPSRRPQSGVKNESPVVSSPRPRAHTPRRADQEASTTQAENSRPSSREKTLMDELGQLRKELAEAQAKATELAAKHNSAEQQSNDLNPVDMLDSRQLGVVQGEGECSDTTKTSVKSEAPQFTPQDVEESTEAEDGTLAKDHPNDATMNGSSDEVPWESLQASDESPSINADEAQCSDNIVPSVVEPADEKDVVSSRESDETVRDLSGTSSTANIDRQNEDGMTGTPAEDTCDVSELQTPTDEKAIQHQLNELDGESITNDAILDGIDILADEISEILEATPTVERSNTSLEVPAEPVTSTEEIIMHDLDTEGPSDCLKHDQAFEFADEFKTCEVSESPCDESTNIALNIATVEEESAVAETLDVGVVLEDASQALGHTHTDDASVLAVVNVVDELPPPGADPELEISAPTLEVANDVEDNDVTASTEVSRDVCSYKMEKKPNSFEQPKSDDSTVNDADDMPEVAVNELPDGEPHLLEMEGKTGVEMENCAVNTDAVDNKIDSESPAIADDVSSIEVANKSIPLVEVATEIDEPMEPVRSGSEVPCLLQEEVKASLPATSEMPEMSPQENENVILVFESADSVAEALIEIVECVSANQSSDDSPGNVDTPMSTDGDAVDLTEHTTPASTQDLILSETPEAYMAKVLVDFAECTALSKVISLQQRSDGSERVEELPHVTDVMEDVVIQAIDILDGEDNADGITSAKEELPSPVLNAEVEDITTTLIEPDTDTAALDTPIDGEEVVSDDCDTPASAEVDAGTFADVDEPAAMNDKVNEKGDVMREQPTACADESGLAFCATDSIAENNEDVHEVAAIVRDLLEMLDPAPSISENKEIDDAVADANASTNPVEEVAVDSSLSTSTTDIDDSATNLMEDSSLMVDAATAPNDTQQIKDEAAPIDITGQESYCGDQEDIPSTKQSGNVDATPSEPIDCIANGVADTHTIARDFVDTVEAEALSSVAISLQNRSSGDSKVHEYGELESASFVESNNLASKEQNDPSVINYSEAITEVPEERCNMINETSVCLSHSADEEVESNGCVEIKCTSKEEEDSVEIAQVIQDIVEAVENELLAVPAAVEFMSEFSDAVEAPIVLDVEDSRAPICDEFSTQEIVTCMASVLASQAIAVALGRLSQSCDFVQSEDLLSDATDVALVDVTKEQPGDTTVPIVAPEASGGQQQQAAAAAGELQKKLPVEISSNDDSILSHVTGSSSNSTPEENLVVEDLLPTTINIAVPSDKIDHDEDELESIIESMIRDIVDAVENRGQVGKESGSKVVEEGDEPNSSVSDKAAEVDFIQAKQVEFEASESLDTNTLKTDDTDKHDEIELYAATRFGSSLEDDKHVIDLTVESLLDTIAANDKVDPTKEPAVKRRCAPKHARSVRFAKEAQPDRLNAPRRSVLLWQAPNDKTCTKEAVENSAKRRASKRRISRRTLPDLLEFPTETARIISSDTTLVAYDARHEQGHIFSLLDQSILTIDPNGRHIDLDDSDERVQSKIIGKRKTLTQEIHSKNLALRQIPRFNYMPMRIKFQWSDFVVATPVRPSTSNLGEVKPPVEPMRLLLKKGAKLPCGSYVIVSAFIRPLEDGNENLRVQIYDAERVEEFQFDFSEDIMKKYHLEKTGMEAQSLEFLGHLEFRRDEDTIVIKLPEKKAGEGSKSDMDRIQSELTMVREKREPPV